MSDGHHYLLVRLPTVDSTNAWCQREVSRLPALAVVVAETQTAGRGRLGRPWHSPPGGNLYLSILIRPPTGAAPLAAFPMLAAVATLHAAQAHGVADAWIKWPNDVLVGADQKLAGVLIELVPLTGGGEAIIVGIGMNLNLDATALAAIDRPATSLAAATGRAADPEDVRETLVEEFLTAYDQAYLSGVAPIHARWAAASRLVGRPITLTTVTGTLTGEVVALNPDASLTLRLPDGSTQQVLAGDVTRHA